MQHKADIAEQRPVAPLLLTATSGTSALVTTPSCPTPLVTFGTQRCLHPLPPSQQLNKRPQTNTNHTEAVGKRS